MSTTSVQFTQEKETMLITLYGQALQSYAAQADQRMTNFLAKQPAATVPHLGCGLYRCGRH